MHSWDIPSWNASITPCERDMSPLPHVVNVTPFQADIPVVMKPMNEAITQIGVSILYPYLFMAFLSNLFLEMLQRRSR